MVNFGAVWVEIISSVSCIPLGNWIPPAGKWKRESGDNFSQFFSETGCFELKPQGNYFCPCPNSGLILLKFVWYSFLNILIVSDEGGGLLGGQQGTFPSGQDIFPSLLGGLFGCCRFALDFNKHHQGVKEFEGDKKFREVFWYFGIWDNTKSYFHLALTRTRSTQFNFVLGFHCAVNCSIIQSGESGVVGTWWWQWGWLMGSQVSAGTAAPLWERLPQRNGRSGIKEGGQR